MRALLISTYDLGDPRLGEYADALHEIALGDSSVLFLNMFEAMGPFEELNERYLTDGVHPTLEGSQLMADKLWGLIDTAAASNVPEPTGVGVVGLLGAAALLRDEDPHHGVVAIAGGDERQPVGVVPVEVAEQQRPPEGTAVEEAGHAVEARPRVEDERREGAVLRQGHAGRVPADRRELCAGCGP